MNRVKHNVNTTLKKNNSYSSLPDKQAVNYNKIQVISFILFD